MSATTAIEWTDHSWSPWWGCTPVSPGCANCYAARWSKFTRGIEYRRGAPRVLAKDWKTLHRWNEEAGLRDERRRVFPSMCDPFDEEVEDDWKLALFDTITETPNLDWLLLTKRPEAALRFFERHVWVHSELGELPPERRQRFTAEFLPNIWLGVSVENQEQADKRIPILLQIPVKVRFLSVEPLLGPIDLSPYLWASGDDGEPAPRNEPYQPKLHWVIVGGESGPRSRPCDLNWIRSIVDQCKGAGAPVFVKQLGSVPVIECSCSSYGEDPANCQACNGTGWAQPFGSLDHHKGGDPSEWPEDLRVREFPKV